MVYVVSTQTVCRQRSRLKCLWWEQQQNTDECYRSTNRLPVFKRPLCKRFKSGTCVLSDPVGSQYKTALISDSTALTQTSVEAERPGTRGQCFARCACLPVPPSFRWYQIVYCLNTSIDIQITFHTQYACPVIEGHANTPSFSNRSYLSLDAPVTSQYIG